MGEDVLHDLGWAELVLRAADEELGLDAFGEEAVGVVASGSADGETETDEALDADVSAAGAEAYVRSEGKAGEEDGELVVVLEPAQGGADVVLLAVAVVVGSLAEARAAKVEAQDGEAKGGERLHGVVDDLIVHGSAAWRVRVADDGGVGRVGAAGVEQCFEASGGAVEIVDGADLADQRWGFLVRRHGGPVYRLGPMGRLFCVGMHLDPIELTRQLVNIESISYHEGVVGAFLYEYLEAQGYAVERMAVEQPDPDRTPGGGTGERFNVYAVMPGVTAEVVLSTHMDTVPPFFGCSEDDEYLYGRGTCDAKGIIAAQVAAADRLREAGVKVGLLFVVGEERDSGGAAVANRNPRGSRFLINGEPTDNRLALATKGALRVEIRASGRMAHSAYPELGESAIDKLLAALYDVQALQLPIEPEIGPSTMNVGLIHGGRAPNVIADKAEAHLLIRTVGPSDGIKEAILKAVGDRAEVSFSLDLSFVKMRRVGSLPTMIAKLATDIPSLTSWGEPFLLGPGSIHVAHTTDERISKKELLECVELYVELATSLVKS